MGLNSFWSDKDNNTKTDVGFSSRSTGCDCCSNQLDTKEEVRKEVVDSLIEILAAKEYFKFGFVGLIRDAKEGLKERRKKSAEHQKKYPRE
jgi:hypothetical protein